VHNERHLRLFVGFLAEGMSGMRPADLGFRGVFSRIEGYSSLEHEEQRHYVSPAIDHFLPADAASPAVSIARQASPSRQPASASAHKVK